MEKCISTIKANVNKEIQTQVKMAKDAKVQVNHAHKEIKTNTPWIEVVKNLKRNIGG